MLEQALQRNGYIHQLGSRLAPLGFRVPAFKLEKVLRHMNWDVDLAVTAFCMSPPPSWLMIIVGAQTFREK